jgi:tRNA-2-methylthio-N6-dimethylallyladenosine synthase
MNAHDSERISGLLEQDGMQRVESEDDADVIVLNTCCIRENADEKLYGTLGWLKPWKEAGIAQGRERQIMVAGCLAQKDKELVRSKAPYVDVVMGTHNVHRAVELLDIAATRGAVTEIFDEAVIDDHALFPSALPVRREKSYNAWVTIQIGCDNTCTYCIVPSVRGKEISRPFADIVDEVRQLAQTGVTEVSLLGQNVNSYGRDLSLTARKEGDASVKVRPQFGELLRAVGSVEGIRRVRYVSPHPKDMNLETLQAMAQVDAVCEHLHYPLQSGSDRVLSLMHRGYTAEKYLARLTEARALITDLAVTTDIIVGFPGETEEDFQRTMDVAAQAMFDSAYLFIFSPREGTQAATMQEHFVDAEVAGDRYNRIKVVLDRTALIKHQERIGRIEEVIVEGVNKRDENKMTGRTRQNKLVHFATPELLRVGTYASVRIEDAARFHLSGTLVDVGAAPTHKVHLSVQAVGQ